MGKEGKVEGEGEGENLKHTVHQTRSPTCDSIS